MAELGEPVVKSLPDSKNKTLCVAKHTIYWYTAYTGKTLTETWKCFYYWLILTRTLSSVIKQLSEQVHILQETVTFGF